MLFRSHAHAAAHAPAHAAAPAHSAAHAAPPSPAVHAGISVDERAYEQYQSLAKAVLESAEIASRSAEAAMAVSRELKQATGNFRELSDAGYKKGVNDCIKIIKKEEILYRIGLVKPLQNSFKELIE